MKTACYFCLRWVEKPYRVSHRFLKKEGHSFSFSSSKEWPRITLKLWGWTIKGKRRCPTSSANGQVSALLTAPKAKHLHPEAGVSGTGSILFSFSPMTCCPPQSSGNSITEQVTFTKLEPLATPGLAKHALRGHLWKSGLCRGNGGKVSGTLYKALLQPHHAGERHSLSNTILSLVCTILITIVWVFPHTSSSWTSAGHPTVQLNSDSTWREYQIPQVKSSVPPDWPPPHPTNHFRCQSQVQVVTCASDQSAIDWSFQRLPPQVRL